LAALRAAWLSVAARVWASSATSISRTCRPSTSTEAATADRKSATDAVTALCAATVKMPSSTPIEIRLPTNDRRADRSTRRPPRTMPTTMPRPYDARMIGIHFESRPARSVMVGAM